ncbi:TetR/AcrR family transcriptional regulator [Jeongeupia naejangsanensis]|uniref:TetR/AcrR family transcriptional regulator n=1 Tax=Jeongeupia naejangsanensis TaxID=613195 RepID=A0ABS2BFC5_9NEIS|nr:TetR/AcrR family transcriptional regulator [Jeongeupia naejangsanensis]MBM3114303.1 TetR/AcrR family transcriptional regulator [Jeongeupia naejangsanensis]
MEEKASDCRQRIVTAALEVFRECGYRASVDRVAQRAGVARQTIYNHFTSKSVLFSAVLQEGCAAHRERLVTCEGALAERLLHFALGLQANLLTPTSINLHRLLTHEASRFPELAGQVYANGVEATAQQLAAVLAKAMTNGELREDDPKLAADIFLDVIVSHDRQRLLFCMPLAEAEAQLQLLRRRIEVFLRAYRIE